MTKVPLTHYIIEIKTVSKQLNSLNSQLKDYNGTVEGKAVIKGLIEAYIAISMQEKICLPDKKFL